MHIQAFHDNETGTLTYVVHDPRTLDGIVIDSVLDFDPATNQVTERSITAVVDYLRQNSIRLHGILETHAHADHLSASQKLKEYFPASKIIIGEKIKLVQTTFAASKTDASQFDQTLKDFAEVHFGSLHLRALPTPGHTPACMSYLIGDAVFTGDALFMPDAGTGRCDFPQGSARALYRSVMENIYSLPDATRIFVGHDYCPNGRELRFQTTVGESKRSNIHLMSETTEADYVKFRDERDRTLKEPRLLKQSLQVNLEAGKLAPGMTRARD